MQAQKSAKCSAEGIFFQHYDRTFIVVGFFCKQVALQALLQLAYGKKDAFKD